MVLAVDHDDLVSLSEIPQHFLDSRSKTVRTLHDERDGSIIHSYQVARYLPLHHPQAPAAGYEGIIASNHIVDEVAHGPSADYHLIHPVQRGNAVENDYDSRRHQRIGSITAELTGNNPSDQFQIRLERRPYVPGRRIFHAVGTASAQSACPLLDYWQVACPAPPQRHLSEYHSSHTISVFYFIGLSPEGFFCYITDVRSLSARGVLAEAAAMPVAQILIFRSVRPFPGRNSGIAARGAVVEAIVLKMLYNNPSILSLRCCEWSRA